MKSLNCLCSPNATNDYLLEQKEDRFQESFIKPLFWRTQLIEIGLPFHFSKPLLKTLSILKFVFYLARWALGGACGIARVYAATHVFHGAFCPCTSESLATILIFMLYRFSSFFFKKPVGPKCNCIVVMKCEVTFPSVFPPLSPSVFYANAVHKPHSRSQWLAGIPGGDCYKWCYPPTANCLSQTSARKLFWHWNLRPSFSRRRSSEAQILAWALVWLVFF